MLLWPTFEQATSSCPPCHLMTHAGRRRRDGREVKGSGRCSSGIYDEQATMQSVQPHLNSDVPLFHFSSFYKFCQAASFPGQQNGLWSSLVECKFQNKDFGVQQHRRVFHWQSQHISCADRRRPCRQQAGILNSPVPRPESPSIAQPHVPGRQAMSGTRVPLISHALWWW